MIGDDVIKVHGDDFTDQVDPVRRWMYCVQGLFPGSTRPTIIGQRYGRKVDRQQEGLPSIKIQEKSVVQATNEKMTLHFELEVFKMTRLAR